MSSFRYYLQLPTEAAHEYHMLNASNPQTQNIPFEGPSSTMTEKESLSKGMDPRVAHKIRELVAGGKSRLYDIRKELR